jgi:hypothetical protein
MKRYFLVPPGLLPHEVRDMPYIGEYHYIDLDSHGAAGAGHRALVMMDDKKAAPAGWLPLPHLLDAQTTLADFSAAAVPAPAVLEDGTMGVAAAAPPVPVAVLPLLADVGADASHSGYSLAKQLATIHTAFEP